MNVIHITYACVHDYRDPGSWLRRIGFFTGLLEAMTKEAEIKSIHCISYTGTLKRNQVEYHFLKLNKFQALFPFRIHKYLRKLQPDVVIVQGMSFPGQVLLLSFQLNRRVKIMVQHRAEKPFTGIKRILQKQADKYIHRYFFSATELAHPWIQDQLIRNPSKVIEVLGLSSSFYPTSKAIARSTTQVSGELVYLWVGSLNENKNPALIVRSFTSFLKRTDRKVSLYIIYQTEALLSEVKSLVKESSADSIRLVSKIEHDHLLHWYNSADFIVSTSYYESSGAAVCEGMSCGCIPILTRIPSFKMMTKDGTIGLLFEPADVKDLSEALMKSTALDMITERNKVLRQFRKNLSFEAISGKMIQAAQAH